MSWSSSSSTSSSPPRPNSVAVVREIYDTENAEETFERDLDRALEIGYEVIIVEPVRLGEETARWIKVGNCLHKCAVVFGVSSICLSVSWNRNPNTLVIPLSIGSVLCVSLYMISWQFDPCCQYQVAGSAEAAAKLKSMSGDSVYPVTARYDLGELRSAAADAPSTSASVGAPTVLVRKSDYRRKIIHSAIATVAFALAAFRFCT